MNAKSSTVPNQIWFIGTAVFFKQEAAMPIQMVRCTFCRKTVSKRSTLSLETLGAGDGRACRTHEFVAELVDELQQSRQEQKAMNAAMRALKVMSGIAFIRVMHTVHQTSLEFLYSLMRSRGYTPDLIAEIREGVDKQGGPRMTEQEIQDTIFTAVHLKEKDLLNV